MLEQLPSHICAKARGRKMEWERIPQSVTTKHAPPRGQRTTATHRGVEVSVERLPHPGAHHLIVMRGVPAAVARVGRWRRRRPVVPPIRLATARRPLVERARLPNARPCRARGGVRQTRLRAQRGVAARRRGRCVPAHTRHAQDDAGTPTGEGQREQTGQPPWHGLPARLEHRDVFEVVFPGFDSCDA